MSGENHHHVAPTRMLERRVSNNRADLNSDQQMNYFLGWFQSWSDLQKSDFVPILVRIYNSFYLFFLTKYRNLTLKKITMFFRLKKLGKLHQK